MSGATDQIAADVDVIALANFLDAAVPGLRRGPLSCRLISGGRSNLTYAVSDGTQRWVVRRPPLGHVLDSAHDMGREYRVMSALRPSAVPVPVTVALCTDPGVLGAPFYVMTFVEGTVHRDAEGLAALAGQPSRALADGLVDALCAVHAVRPQDVGLDRLGRPVGYLERQVTRWRGQLAASWSRPLPRLDALADRLVAGLPRTRRAGLVHGDFRLDNVVVDDGDPGRVSAVLDWEMATLGDPLTDLASCVVWWDGVAGLDSPVAAVPGEVPGFPPSERLVDRYRERSGEQLDDFDWYVAFAFFKIASIFEGIHYRHVHGATVGDGFDALGAMVEPLVDRGHAALDVHEAP